MAFTPVASSGRARSSSLIANAQRCCSSRARHPLRELHARLLSNACRMAMDIYGVYDDGEVLIADAVADSSNNTSVTSAEQQASADTTAEEERVMRRCVELSLTAVGHTRPNPIVGCVILSKEGLVVGEGFHARAGEPHAEAVALRIAGDRARDGTAFVSLEPCNHYGRTPPCADALVRAGVRRVVIGMIDPDERTAGSGVEKLRRNGIEVSVGVCEALCRRVNEGFVHRVRHKVPLGTWKFASSLDGKIATESGHSRWVSGAASRVIVQHLRAESDAIIVGGETVRRDDPQLTRRQADSSTRNDPVGMKSSPQPRRVVMTRSMQLPVNARLWDVSEAPTTVLTLPGVRPDFQAQLRDRGVDVEEVHALDAAAAMRILFERGALNVLWECGGALAREAVQGQCVQRVYAFLAPKIVGGSGRYSPLGDMGIRSMTDAVALRGMRVRSIGEDLLITGRLPSSTMM